MPRRGIDWCTYSVPATTKIATHEWQLRVLAKRGISEDDILKHRYTVLPHGFAGKRNADLFIEYVEHMVPDFRNYYETHSTGHANGYGRALTDRAQNSLVNGEINRFRQPEWTPFYSMILEHVSSEKPIGPFDMASAHEQIIRIAARGKPGVYVHQAPGRRHDIYIGTGKDAAKRGYRNNGDLRLARVYCTETATIADDIEASLHTAVVRLRDLLVRVRFPERPVGQQGTYTFVEGCDGVFVIDSIVDQHYAKFCRAKLGPPTEQPQYVSHGESPCLF